MELIIFILILAFMVLFTLLGAWAWEIAAANIILVLVTIGEILVNGLTEIQGYQGGEAVTVNYGLSVIVLIPVFLAFLNLLCVWKREQRR